MIVRNRLSDKNSYSTIPPILIFRMHTPHARERRETAEISLRVLPWESCDKKWVIAQPESRFLNQGGSQL
jgi:hypothetical protein